MGFGAMIPNAMMNGGVSKYMNFNPCLQAKERHFDALMGILFTKIQFRSSHHPFVAQFQHELFPPIAVDAEI